MGHLGEFILSFLFICAVIAFTCAAIKQEKWPNILQKGLRYFLYTTLGIAAFASLIELISYLWIP